MIPQLSFLENNRSKFDCDRDNRYIIQYANLFHNELERYSYNVSIRPRACFFPLFSFLPLWLHYNLNPLCVQY